MKDYGMFTDAGNALVADIVELAKKHGWSYAIVMSMMEAIGTDECFGEITDSAFREEIGEELGWYA